MTSSQAHTWPPIYDKLRVRANFLPARVSRLAAPVFPFACKRLICRRFLQQPEVCIFIPLLWLCNILVSSAGRPPRRAPPSRRPSARGRGHLFHVDTVNRGFCRTSLRRGSVWQSVSIPPAFGRLFRRGAPSRAALRVVDSLSPYGHRENQGARFPPRPCREGVALYPHRHAAILVHVRETFHH